MWCMDDQEVNFGKLASQRHKHVSLPRQQHSEILVGDPQHSLALSSPSDLSVEPKLDVTTLTLALGPREQSRVVSGYQRLRLSSVALLDEE